MRYEMVGDVFEDDAQKLERFVGVVSWKYLRPHYQSGVLYFVDGSLDLVEVGKLFAEDRADGVERHLRAGDLVKIEDLHTKQWENKDVQFEALVISPFVLCRPVVGE